MSDFEIVCCNLTYKAKRYRVKPYKTNCISEEYKIVTCVKCGTLKIDVKRTVLRPNKKEFSYTQHLHGKKAQEYLFDLAYFNRQITEIHDEKIKTGSKTGINLFYGVKNSIKNFNDKTVGSRVTNPIKGDFKNKHLETVLAG